MTSIWIALHITGIAGLSLYGLLGFLTLWLFLHHRRDARVEFCPQVDDWPTVAVQLPLFNERDVVERIISSAARLDYPRDRLLIQVLDDSTDDTTELAAACVARYQAHGYAICLIHRDHRRGFKAGALQGGLEKTDAQLIAIFDADFTPTPDFLIRTIPHLISDSSVGAVQARWGHLNDNFSTFTGAQGVALDKHFAIDQFVRFRVDYFPKFNGSAGIWRRECIVAAGGWQEDTVCEDLCLSTRAVLAGWKFYFAGDVVAPAELPSTMLAYKSQQARWATGATQCLFKYGRSIWCSRNHSLAARVYSLMTMAAYSTHLLLLLILLVQLPMVLSGYQLPSWLMVLGLMGLGQPILFAISQHILHRDWLKRIRYLPTLLLIAIGTAPSNSWAIIRALLVSDFTFERTPKGLRRSYKSGSGYIAFLEIALLLYLIITLYFAIQKGNPGPLVLVFSSILGIGYVTATSIKEIFINRRP